MPAMKHTAQDRSTLARARAHLSQFCSRAFTRASTTFLVASVPLTLIGCAGNKLTPTIESSAQESSYALVYPAALEHQRKLLAEDKSKAGELTGTLREREIKANADPKLLEEIVEASDSAGRSHTFVAAQREARAFRAFWDEERAPIAARVTAAAQKQIADAGCPQEVDVAGATSHALKEGFERQLEKRVREHNEAQHIIEHSRAAFPGPSLSEVQKLADDVAYASYLVNVALIDDKDNIERMLSERRGVASTLDDSLERERKYLSEQAKTKEEKKTAEERIAELEKSKAALDGTVRDAENESKELEQSIRQAQGDYDAAYDGLIERIKARPAPVASK
jgi:hypothetical protein